jgi:hypothetical protein
MANDVSLWLPWSKRANSEGRLGHIVSRQIPILNEWEAESKKGLGCTGLIVYKQEESVVWDCGHWRSERQQLEALTTGWTRAWEFDKLTRWERWKKGREEKMRSICKPEGWRCSIIPYLNTREQRSLRGCHSVCYSTIISLGFPVCKQVTTTLESWQWDNDSDFISSSIIASVNERDTTPWHSFSRYTTSFVL